MKLMREGRRGMNRRREGKAMAWKNGEGRDEEELGRERGMNDEDEGSMYKIWKENRNKGISKWMLIHFNPTHLSTNFNIFCAIMGTEPRTIRPVA